MSQNKYYDKIAELNMRIDSILIYRNLLKDPLIACYRTLLKSAAGDAEAVHRMGYSDLSFAGLYAEFFHQLGRCCTDLRLCDHIIEKLLQDENPFTEAASSGLLSTGGQLAPAVRSDLCTLHAAAALSPAEIKSCYIEGFCSIPAEKALIGALPEWVAGNEIVSGSVKSEVESSYIKMKTSLIDSEAWEDIFEKLLNYHKEFGCGQFLKYRAFSWQHTGRLIPVLRPDPVRLADLIAYESEREAVISNTKHFIGGSPANNVLLYGDRGTGKSSTVKAILNEYHGNGLRMVEVQKQFLSDFPEIVRSLSGRRQKFIIFIDDLAFEDNEENYTALKAVLEGSMEIKPENVVIYATSNRRHLIKEKFSDRSGLSYGDREDEVRAADSIQEKLSLSDRFGITVVFPSPDKSRYLRIVDELAAKEGIGIDRETLHREALKWELWYNGRSPRTARQFIGWIKGSL